MDTKLRKKQMIPKEALQLVIERFPFKGYMEQAKGAYLNIANTTLRFLCPGSRILDFGCGPCDKTAILQNLGFKCSAYDDLQDDWHKVNGNKEKILAFARDSGIDFRLPNNRNLPFEKNYFDMLMLHDVLEHLHDSPRDILSDLLELIKPEGFLFVTVPNAVNIRKRLDVLFGRSNLPRFEIYFWYPGHWRGHVREYVRDDLVKLSEYLNLEIVELRACDHMIEKKLPIFARPVYLAVTRLFTGWKDSWLLLAKKSPNWVPKKTLPSDELARIMAKSTPYQY